VEEITGTNDEQNVNNPNVVPIQSLPEFETDNERISLLVKPEFKDVYDPD
jgi:hypothetical protein